MKTSNRRLARLEDKLALDARATAQAAAEPQQPPAYVAMHDPDRPGATMRLLHLALERGGYLAAVTPQSAWPEAELGERTSPDGWLVPAATWVDAEVLRGKLQGVVHLIVNPVGDVIIIPAMGADPALAEATIAAIEARYDGKPA